MRPLAEYKTLVFDCDGVVLNSNQLKIKAYHDVAIKFGASQVQAQALVEHHVEFGGISRYSKFEYFLREIMKQVITAQAMQTLLDSFTEEVKRLLMDCEVSSDLMNFRGANPSAKWMIISGGDQAELREIFKQRGIDQLFDAGIYGRPDHKDAILAREIDVGNIIKPALFIGDSRYDHQASTNAGLDFVFLNAWTDVEGWQNYCASHQIAVFKHLGDLI